MDVLVSIQRIERSIQGLSFNTFVQDEVRFDAVIRNLEVIGEAARFIPPDIEARHPDVPWAGIRGMRNVLAHEYFGVDEEIIWQTVTEALPPLAVALSNLLATEPENGERS